MTKFRNIAIAAVTLIGTVNTIGYSYLSQKQDVFNDGNRNESQEISNLEDDRVESLDNNSIQSNNDNKKPYIENEYDSIVGTDILSTEDSKITATESDKTEAKSEIDDNDNDNDNTLYSIRNIKENVSYHYNYSMAFWNLDVAHDSINIIEWDNPNRKYLLNKISLSSGESVTISNESLDESLNESIKELIYNPYIGDMFIKFKNSLVNLNTGEIYEYKGYHDAVEWSYLGARFVDSTELMEIKAAAMGSVYIAGESWKLTNGNLDNYKYGFIDKLDSSLEKLMYIQPFVVDDCYYWIYKTNKNSSYKLLYTMQSVKNNTEECQGAIELFDAVACAVSNNEVYFMASDCSIYKLNMDLIAGKEPIESNAPVGKNIYNDSSSAYLTKYCTLYIDGKQIKQTGKSNINQVESFYIRNNGDIVMFDSLDSTIKVIEKD